MEVKSHLTVSASLLMKLGVMDISSNEKSIYIYRYSVCNVSWYLMCPFSPDTGFCPTETAKSYTAVKSISSSSIVAFRGDSLHQKVTRTIQQYAFCLKLSDICPAVHSGSVFLLHNHHLNSPHTHYCVHQSICGELWYYPANRPGRIQWEGHHSLYDTNNIYCTTRNYFLFSLERQ